MGQGEGLWRVEGRVKAGVRRHVAAPGLGSRLCTSPSPNKQFGCFLEDSRGVINIVLPEEWLHRNYVTRITLASNIVEQ